jgi:sialate O-acetylesterase
MNSKILFISIFLFSAIYLNAKIKVASVLGDNMVLQRNTEVKLWGTAEPNQKLTIITGWNKAKISTVASESGQWLVKAKTTDAGGPFIISIVSGKEKIQLQNILLGEVWLCSGQSNMEMPMLGFNDQPINASNEALAEANNCQLRLFTVKRLSIKTPQDTCVGNWELATAQTVGKFSAVGYHFANRLQKALKVPVGVINSSWGGSRIEGWINSENMKKFPESLKSTTQEKTAPNQRASYLYNGMIHPIKNYSIKGAIWYQGESNRGEYQYYADLMKAMVEEWKSDFELKEFPFYFVQIAPYWYNNSKDILSGKFYDEQYKASLNIPRAGMVATVDFGEELCIHPAEKKAVGQRLTYWALSETYGVNGIAYKNPVYKDVVVKDSSLVVSFDNLVNGLTSFGKEITNFEIAGEDQKFYSATAKIKSKQVILTASEVKKPIAARYCYINYPVGKGFLYNTAGLPILPFRTDNW